MPMSSNPLTDVSIVGPWPRSRGGSRSGVSEGQCSDLSSPRMIRTRLRLGSKTSSGFSRSSMCVESILLGICVLSTPFQTQLTIDTHMAVADTQTMVTDTQTKVTDTQSKVTDTQTVVMDTRTIVADTQTMVADMHRRVLTGQEGTSGQKRSVSANFHPLPSECS